MLTAAGVASPEHDARALAAHVLGGVRPAEVALADELPEAPYRALVEQRAQRVPLQHLVGTVGFRHLVLEVGPGVFVPRPETELVAGAVIDELAARGARIARAFPVPAAPQPELRAQFAAGERPLVVDLCSGSGVIALSVAHEVPDAVVHAVELDPGALAWARRNDPDGLVTWHQGAVEGCLPELDGRVDVVVSNPPYVPVGTPVDPETERDPQLALWSGADGLDVVREVAAAARRLLRPGGLVVVEHDASQGRTAPAAFEGWAEVRDHRDLAGRDRFLTARWQA